MSDPLDENYGISDWCAKAKLGRSSFYGLPPEIAPKQITVGRRRIIIENPRHWAERVAVRADSVVKK